MKLKRVLNRFLKMSQARSVQAGQRYLRHFPNSDGESGETEMKNALDYAPSMYKDVLKWVLNTAEVPQADKQF
jgi:hypothetical protein